MERLIAVLLCIGGLVASREKHQTQVRNALMSERLMIGCYGDDPDSPDLSHLLWSSDENSGFQCIEACRQQGFLYAGTQDTECFCGDNVYRRYGESETCAISCPGNPLETCGGPQANSVFKVPSDIHYEGCFVENENDRDLPFYMWPASEGRSPVDCIAECSRENFLYAGVQAGGDCYCGGRYGKHGVPEMGEMQCNSTCRGGWSEQNCGGEGANAIYATGLAVHFSNIGSADPGLMALYEDSTSFTGVPLGLFTSFPNLKSVISPRVVLHATESVLAPSEDPVCAGNCYTPCGDVTTQEGLVTSSRDVIVRAFYIDLSNLGDHVGNNPERVFVYAQTVVIDRNIAVPYTLLVRARQIILNRQTASQITVSASNPLLDIDMEEARHLGPQGDLLFQKQSFMCGRILYDTAEQEHVNKAWAITGDILSDNTFSGEQEAWVNSIKYFRAHLTGIQRNDLSFVPFYSKNYFRQILENYYNQISLYNDKFTRLGDQLTSDKDFVQFVDDMLKIQTGTNIAEARSSFEASVNSVTRSKNTHSRLRDQFTLARLDMRTNAEVLIQDIIREIIGNFMRGLVGMIRSIINLCLGRVNPEDTDQMEDDLRGVIPEVVGLAEILEELTYSNIELEGFMDASDEIVEVLADETAMLTYDFQQHMGTIEYTARLQVNVVRWQNLYKRVEVVMSDGALTAIPSSRPYMLSMLEVCNWGEAQVRSMVEHAESLRDCVQKHYTWRSKVQQQDRYQEYLDDLRNDLSQRENMLAAMAEQTFDIRLDLNDVLLSFCQAFFYENLQPCNDLYRPEFGGTMYDLLMKINLARYDAILENSPGSTAERIITITDSDTDPECTDSDICPVNYFRNNKILYWRVPLDHPDLSDLDKYHVSEITVDVEGAKVNPATNNPWLKLLIESSGVFEAKYGGQSFGFLTRPMTQSYEYNINTGHKSIRADIHQSVRHVVQHITPYTTWIIRISDMRSGDVDLSQVSHIDVQFSGSAVDPPTY